MTGSALRAIDATPSATRMSASAGRNPKNSLRISAHRPRGGSVREEPQPTTRSPPAPRRCARDPPLLPLPRFFPHGHAIGLHPRHSPHQPAAALACGRQAWTPAVSGSGGASSLRGGGFVPLGQALQIRSEVQVARRSKSSSAWSSGAPVRTQGTAINRVVTPAVCATSAAVARAGLEPSEDVKGARGEPPYGTGIETPFKREGGRPAAAAL